MDKSLFGIDMDLDGRASALDDLLFIHMVENDVRSNMDSIESEDEFVDESDDFDYNEEADG